jgi:ABC-type transport system substrate-binding protein
MRKLLMAAALAVGLGAGMAGTEARTVRWAASGDPNTMDPHSQNLGTVTMVLQQIYDPLIQRTQDLGLAPDLALRLARATVRTVVIAVLAIVLPSSSSVPPLMEATAP